MAKSPSYNVIVANKNLDVTELITSITYEDCVEEDDLITFNVEGISQEIVDKDYFNKTQELHFTFGFIGGQMSATKIAVINNVSWNYIGSKINMTIKCRDGGVVTKKVSNNKVYKNVTTTEIVKDVASCFGFSVDVEEFNTKHDFLPMANKNYMQFLRELASSEGSIKSDKKGNISVWVTGKTLHFKRRDLSKKSQRTFTWMDGNGIMKDFNVTDKDDDSGKSNGVATGGIDLDTGEKFKSKAEKSENKEAATGLNPANFNVDGFIKKNTGVLNMDKFIKDSFGDLIGKQIAIAANNKVEADKKTGGHLKSGATSGLEFDAELELDPTIIADSMVTIAGVAKKHSGNWYVSKCVHEVNSSGGSTKISGPRNGSQAKTTTGNNKNAGDVNKTQGNTEGGIFEVIKNFTANGKILN